MPKSKRDVTEADLARIADAMADPDPEPIEDPDEAAPIEEPPVDTIAVAAAERRKRLLGDLDAETAALFTDDDLIKIEAEEQAKAKAEQKKQALATIRATAKQIAQVEHDLISASVLRSDDDRRRLAEPVTFRVRLPGDGAGHRGQNGLRVDGFLYQDGREYTRPRAIFESLQANHYRAWLSEYQFRFLDQHKPGNSAAARLAETLPQFEVKNAA